MLHGVTPRQFSNDLRRRIREDNIFSGAAALAYYLTLAIFPALILVMTLIPYLPVEQVEETLMHALAQGLPPSASEMVAGVLHEVTRQRKAGLLSVGLLLTLWAMSTGMYAIMKQLNITYDAREKRNFFHGRAIALALSMVFLLLVIGASVLVVLGDRIQGWLGLKGIALAAFAVLRWLVVVAVLLAALAIIYRFGPNISHRFRFITPGGVIAVILLVLASLAFSFYVNHFANYNATYGSIGAVIVLMLWLYITGLVILLGSEINAVLEQYAGPRAVR